MIFFHCNQYLYNSLEYLTMITKRDLRNIIRSTEELGVYLIPETYDKLLEHRKVLNFTNFFKDSITYSYFNY